LTSKRRIWGEEEGNKCLTWLLQAEVVRGFLGGVVDGDESGCTVDHLGGGHRHRRTRGAVLVGTGVFGVGTGDVGALAGHGALAVAAAVAEGLAVLVTAGDGRRREMMLAEPRLIRVRGRRH
jgi:hypothetical protein